MTAIGESGRLSDRGLQRSEVATHAKEAGLRLVRFLYCDNAG
jgi:hypothetical protein